MATRFASGERRRHYGPGPLAIAAIAGAVFGGLAVAVTANRGGLLVADGAAGLPAWALIALGALLVIMLAFNVWARMEARRHSQRIDELLANATTENERARRLVSELLRGDASDARQQRSNEA